MCTSQAEGGRRCAAHTRVEVGRHPIGTYKYQEALTAHAKTAKGFHEVHALLMESTDPDEIRCAVAALRASERVWEGFSIPASLEKATGHQRRLADNVDALTTAYTARKALRGDVATIERLHAAAVRDLDNSYPALRPIRADYDRAMQSDPTGETPEAERAEKEMRFARRDVGLDVLSMRDIKDDYRYAEEMLGGEWEYEYEDRVDDRVMRSSLMGVSDQEAAGEQIQVLNAKTRLIGPPLTSIPPDYTVQDTYQQFTRTSSLNELRLTHAALMQHGVLDLAEVGNPTDGVTADKAHLAENCQAALRRYEYVSRGLNDPVDWDEDRFPDRDETLESARVYDEAVRQLDRAYGGEVAKARAAFDSALIAEPRHHGAVDRAHHALVNARAHEGGYQVLDWDAIWKGYSF